MPITERQIRVSAPIGKIWGIVSDVQQWGGLFSHMGRWKNIKFSFDPVAVPGPGVLVDSSISAGMRSTKKTWRIVEFDPTGFRISLALMPGRFQWCSMSVGFALRPDSTLVTDVGLRVEFEWTNPVLRMFSSLFPMNTDTLADSLSQNLVEAAGT